MQIAIQTQSDVCSNMHLHECDYSNFDFSPPQIRSRRRLVNLDGIFIDPLKIIIIFLSPYAAYISLYNSRQLATHSHFKNGLAVFLNVIVPVGACCIENLLKFQQAKFLPVSSCCVSQIMQKTNLEKN